MASGSQMCRGIIADLPIPPMKMSTRAQVSTEPPMNTGAAEVAKMFLIPSAVVSLIW